MPLSDVSAKCLGGIVTTIIIMVVLYVLSDTSGVPPVPVQAVPGVKELSDTALLAIIDNNNDTPTLVDKLSSVLDTVKKVRYKSDEDLQLQSGIEHVLSEVSPDTTVPPHTTPPSPPSRICPGPDQAGILSRLREYCGGVPRYRNNWLELIKKYGVHTRHLVYDLKKEYVWYTVPKIASSSWKKLILQDTTGVLITRMSGGHGAHRLIELCCSLNYTVALEHPELQRMFTFTFIRNPWTRLYSAYLDKIKEYPAFEDHYYTKLILYTVKHFTPHQLHDMEFVRREEKNITFLDFLTLLTLEGTEQYNPHWEPWFEVTHACQIKYDYIGYVEDMKSSYEYLQEKVFKNPALSLGPPYTGHAHRDQLISAYRSIPQTILDDIYTKFKDDFIVGGYNRDINCIQ